MNVHTKEYRKLYYTKNKYTINIKNRQYREKNADRVKESRARYRKENKDKISKQKKEYYKENKIKVCVKQQECGHRLKLSAMNQYGGSRCTNCGIEDLDILSIDHIDGGGNEHRREVGGGSIIFYRWLKDNNYPPGFRVLCMNCQFRAKAGNLEGKLFTCRTKDQEYGHLLKIECFNAYGGCSCFICGIKDLDVLTIDHLEGGGRKHREKIGGGGTKFYRWLRNNGFPSGYQVLCMNCQLKKEANKRINYKGY